MEWPAASKGEERENGEGGFGNIPVQSQKILLIIKVHKIISKSGGFENGSKKNAHQGKC